MSIRTPLRPLQAASEALAQVEIVVGSAPSGTATAIALPIAENELDAAAVGRVTLDALGFTGKLGATALLPAADGRVDVAVGLGADALDAAAVRTAAAAFARAAGSHASLAVPLGDAGRFGQAVVEGVLLARHQYTVLVDPKPTDVAVSRIELIVPDDQVAAATAMAERGRVMAAAEVLARDLANTPHSHLNATDLGALAVTLGDTAGFEVELFDKAALVEMGCGGLLAINAGSAEPPLMIKLSYRPANPSGHLALVGKGIMYDSGGLSLKPSDMVHARMKNDMSGAASCLAVVTALARLHAPVALTVLLPCTDNMPSGTATALGDVFTVRNGTTVEMIDTDAEGRVVMADALVMAAEAGPDAIVDIATLTGSVSRAFGTDIAGVFGTNTALMEQVRAAATAADEPVWELPLHRPYRKLLDSQVADIMNCGPLGLPDAILSSLFLSEFTGEIPWAHIDIAGTAWADADKGWRGKGATAFGTRLLLELALAFRPALD